MVRLPLVYVLVAVQSLLSRDCNLDSRNVDHYAEAQRYEKLGDWDCVLQHRQKDAELHKDGDALYNLAIAYEKIDRFQEAVSTWKAASQVEPLDNDILDALEQATGLLEDKHQQRQQIEVGADGGTAAVGSGVFKRADCDFDVVNARDMDMNLFERNYLNK